MSIKTIPAALLALSLLTGCAQSPGGAAIPGAAGGALARSGTAAPFGAQVMAAQLEEEAQEAQAAAQAAAEAAAAEAAAKAEAWSRAEHVYSHRGASGYEVEHTFAAYDLAIEQGSHYIEQDLVSSKEGTLYVSHDDTAARIAGVNRSFRAMDDADIDQLRTANGEPIHSLAAVFERYGQSVCYVVELKQGEEQVAEFVRLVREYGLEEHVIVQSFFPDALLSAEEALPEAPKLWLCRSQDAFNRAVGEESADIVCVKGTLMTEKNCKACHKQGKKFCVYWTDGEEVRHAIELGADCYFTNYTDTALALEKEYRQE